MNLTISTALYLDDMRVPGIPTMGLVKNYDEFVAYIKANGVPDLISFDHDLSIEHYPLFENNPGMTIPYDSYREKTGLHCARYLIENQLPVKYWNVHSMNVTGSDNIRAEMRQHYPQGEMRLKIPFYIPG
jgi:hypothetical protein